MYELPHFEDANDPREGSADESPCPTAYPGLEESPYATLQGPYEAAFLKSCGPYPMDSQDAYPRYLGDPSAYPGAEAYPVEAHMAAHGLGRAEALTAAGAAERRPVWPRRDVAFAYDEPARPLDVVHVGPSLVRGGAERWLIDLVRFLDPRRVRVLRTITTLPNTVDPVLQAAMKIPVEIGQADAVRRAARECDVLLCWGVGLNDWLADCRPRLCVFVAHGEGDWTRMVIRQSDRVIDHMVAVSRKCSERCSLGLPTTVIWNGVDSGRLSATRSRRAVRKALGFQPGDFVLGYVGRFSREKRPHVMIEAVARLPAHCKALLVGWGGLRNELMEMANEKIPGRFAFVAAWEYLGDYYQAMDALCLQSYEEGFPLAMLEGMMWARPLILRSFGCVPEVIVDRVNGLVVDGDAASVAAAAELLRRHPRWARAMGAEAKSFAETYGHAQRMARQYENLLHGLWRTKYGPLTAAVN